MAISLGILNIPNIFRQTQMKICVARVRGMSAPADPKRYLQCLFFECFEKRFRSAKRRVKCQKKRMLGEATHLALSALFTSSFSNGAAGCMFTTVPWCGWLGPLHLFSREPLTVCRKEPLVSENRSNKPKCKGQKSWLSMLAQRNIYNELWDKHAHCNLNHHKSITHCNLHAPDGEVVWSPPPHLRPCQHPAKLVCFRYCRGPGRCYVSSRSRSMRERIGVK